jgi:dimethylamine/trimethylamine dehydrogenase
LDVTLVTPAADVSKWTHATLEQGLIEERLYEIGVNIIEKHALAAMTAGEVHIQHVQNGRQRALPCASVLLVTMRLPNDSLYHDLTADAGRLQDAGIRSLTRIGDCLAPSTIAAAVYAGHRYAREADVPPTDGVPFQRELIALA